MNEFLQVGGYNHLIIRLRQSDRKAFDTLYVEFYPRLLNYSSLFVSRETAEDIVQDVFIKLWDNREDIAEESYDGQFRNLLFRMTYNACISVIRRNAAGRNYQNWLQDKVERFYSDYDIEKNEILDVLYSRDMTRTIMEAIEKLPPKCREVFVMTHIDGLSNRQVSEKLSLSLSTVENHNHNALLRLREIILKKN
ncbi:MAG: RNA polymerase sigma-70 factor [Candidatus Cryptobacteroides sp.]